VRPSSGDKLRGLPVRVVTALLYGAVMLSALLWGRTLGWAVVIAVCAACAVAEFYALTRETHRTPNEVFGVVAAASMPIAAATHGAMGLSAVFTILVIASLLWHLFFRQFRLVDTAVTVFGVIYVGFTLSHLVLLRSMDSGTILVLATLASVWLNDTLAYFVGSCIGRRKLAPRISPNKTWEGFFAGTAASVAVWAAVYAITDTGITLGWHLTIGFVLGLAGVVGDLVESRIKREVGAKDSGTLLPGHGGFLDRFDALIMVSVAAYYLLVWAGAQ
jgi:phosphatidate cytidylyltransferase